MTQNFPVIVTNELSNHPNKQNLLADAYPLGQRGDQNDRRTTQVYTQQSGVGWSGKSMRPARGTGVVRSRPTVMLVMETVKEKWRE